jgi:hypothetical protein
LVFAARLVDEAGADARQSELEAQVLGRTRAVRKFAGGAERVQ